MNAWIIVYSSLSPMKEKEGKENMPISNWQTVFNLKKYLFIPYNPTTNNLNPIEGKESTKMYPNLETTTLSKNFWWEFIFLLFPKTILGIDVKQITKCAQIGSLSIDTKFIVLQDSISYTLRIVKKLFF